jgi:predicted enzyme related to lactoylglutathione lyase
MLEIIPSEGDAPASGMKTPGIRHLAIAIDDFDAALASLQAKNVKFVGEPFVNQGNRLAFFEDCDGNLCHLIHREKPLPE